MGGGVAVLCCAELGCGSSGAQPLPMGVEIAFHIVGNHRGSVMSKGGSGGGGKGGAGGGKGRSGGGGAKSPGGGGKGQGNTPNLPSTTGNRSGDGRGNAPSKKA